MSLPDFQLDRFGRRLSFVAATLFCLASSCAKQEELEPVMLYGKALGTKWSVVFVPAAGQDFPGELELEETVLKTIGRVDALMSTFREDSDIGRFNGRPGYLEPFELDPETRKVVAAAIHYARETGGAFDPTVGPLVGLWGFGAGASRDEPVVGQVEEVLERVGFGLLEWNESGHLKRRLPGVELDLSAIAKGYVADAVLEALGRYRPAGLMVEIGGDLRVAGTRASGEPWRLGIQNPDGGLYSVVLSTGGALATSGDYRRYRNRGDERISHIIDPRSGHSAATGIVSVSVLAPTALEADAIATALMVLGEKDGLAYVEERAWLEALFKVRDSETQSINTLRSSGWAASTKE